MALSEIDRLVRDLAGDPALQARCAAALARDVDPVAGAALLQAAGYAIVAADLPLAVAALSLDDAALDEVSGGNWEFKKLKSPFGN